MTAINRADLDAAIAARLSDIPEEIAKEAAGVVFKEWVRATQQPPTKNATAVILERLGVPATRNPSAVFHALVAMAACMAGDIDSYYTAAFVVFEAERQAKRADELPVVRRFYQQEPAKHTKYESEFYKMLSEAKRLRGTMRELDDLGLRTYADAKEQSPLAGEAKPLERAAKNLSGINRDMEAVRRDASLTPDEKRMKLDALTVERNALLKDAVTESKSAQKALAGHHE